MQDYANKCINIKVELDAIVLMALQKEPAKRYNSAQQFAEDIDAYLNNLPIRARKATALATTSKFIRRNLLAVSIAATVFLSLTIMLIVTFTQKNIAQQERARAEKEKEVANIERENSEQVTKVLLNFLELSDPYSNDGELISVASIIDKGTEFLDEMDIKSRSHRTLSLAIAKLLYNKKDFQDEIKLLEKSTKGFEGTPESGGLFEAELLVELSTACAAVSNPEVGVVAFERAKKIRYNLLPPNDYRIAECILLETVYMLDTTDREKLPKMLFEALEIFNHDGRSKKRDIFACYMQLGHYGARTGEYQSGLYYMQIAENYAVSNFEKDHPETINSQRFLAKALGRNMMYDEQEQVLKKCVANANKKLKLEHSLRTNVLKDLLDFYLKKGNFSAIDEVLKENELPKSLCLKLSEVLAAQGLMDEAIDVLITQVEYFKVEDSPMVLAIYQELIKIYTQKFEFEICDYYLSLLLDGLSHNSYYKYFFHKYHLLQAMVLMYEGRHKEAEHYFCVAEEQSSEMMGVKSGHHQNLLFYQLLNSARGSFTSEKDENFNITKDISKFKNNIEFKDLKYIFQASQRMKNILDVFNLEKQMLMPYEKFLCANMLIRQTFDLHGGEMSHIDMENQIFEWINACPISLQSTLVLKYLVCDGFISGEIHPPINYNSEILKISQNLSDRYLASIERYIKNVKNRELHK